MGDQLSFPALRQAPATTRWNQQWRHCRHTGSGTSGLVADELVRDVLTRLVHPLNGET